VRLDATFLAVSCKVHRTERAIVYRVKSSLSLIELILSSVATKPRTVDIYITVVVDQHRRQCFAEKNFTFVFTVKQTHGYSVKRMIILFSFFGHFWYHCNNCQYNVGSIRVVTLYPNMLSCIVYLHCNNLACQLENRCNLKLWFNNTVNFYFSVDLLNSSAVICYCLLYLHFVYCH